ncbi:MAG: hypothetical protein QXG00_00060 [Candidatus Woesearchaeota archaeon]
MNIGLKNFLVYILMFIIVLVIVVGIYKYLLTPIPNNQKNPISYSVNNTQVIKETVRISGYTYLKEGNCMPLVCDTPPCETSCKKTAISTKILILKPTKSLDNAIKIIETRSDTDGFYSLRLPKGEYSIIIYDGITPYCNSYDTNGFMCILNADTDKQFDLTIDKAVY